MSSPDISDRKFHIQPYHMNGLNWTMVPDDPQRDNIVIVTGFMPSWWEKEYGITFRKDFHTNTEVHRATLAKMAAILHERYGYLPNFFFSPFNYEDAYPMERRYGDALLPALFDIEVSFDEVSGHPYTYCLNLTDEDARNLAVPNVQSHPVLNSILDKRKYADLRTVGEPGFEGVINIAYQFRGQEMFVDLIQKPDTIDHVFKVVFETIDQVVHRVRKWADPKGKLPTYFVTCDCLVNMISGPMYRQSLLKYDKQFYESFDMFGIHTCNWTVDPYLDAMAEIGDLVYMDMGSESDLEKVHKLFPDLTPSVFFHPEKLRNLTPSEVTKEITELGKRIGRGYILFCDLEVGTTDDQIRAAYEAVSQL